MVAADGVAYSGCWVLGRGEVNVELVGIRAVVLEGADREGGYIALGVAGGVVHEDPVITGLATLGVTSPNKL